MTAILAVTVPFFALVLCGYLAGRWHVLPESAIPGLNAFVLYFALPCMLFRFGLGTPIADLLNPAVLAVYVLVALLMVGFTVAMTLGRKITLKDAAFGALVAAFPNSGFMGVPMLTALVGPAAIGPLVCSLLADIFITTSLCIGLAETHGAGGWRTAVKRALAGATKNPQPWAIALGGTLRALDIRPPGAVETVVRMLADAATPVALFTIGAVLWRAGQHAHHRTALRHFVPPALFKLLLHPLLVLLGCAAARQLGAPLSAQQAMVLTLTAALPSAANVALLAERFGADNGRIARIILTSTVAAFASFSLLAWAFGVQPIGT